MDGIYASIENLADPAAARGLLVGIAPVAVILVLMVLIFSGALWGNRRRPYRPPSPEEQPRAPEHRAHIEEVLELDDDFGAEQGRIAPGRLTPHELKGYGNFGTHPAHEKRPAHEENSGGASGSGQPGS